MQARLGRFVGLAAGSVALVALVSASVLYLYVSRDGAVHPGGGALGWVQGAEGPSRPPVDNQRHLYVLDGWGGLHPVGASPLLSTSVAWPTTDIASGRAL